MIPKKTTQRSSQQMARKRKTSQLFRTSSQIRTKKRSQDPMQRMKTRK